jgi:hypothetical protein
MALKIAGNFLYLFDDVAQTWVEAEMKFMRLGVEFTVVSISRAVSAIFRKRSRLFQ